MKRLVWITLILTVLILLPQCSAPTETTMHGTSTEDTTTFDPDATDEYGNLLHKPQLFPDGQELIVEKGGEYYLIFEKCDKQVSIRPAASWSMMVNDDLIRRADALIAQDIPPSGDGVLSFWYDETGKRFVVSFSSVEKIDPPNVQIIDGVEVTTGCDIDHRHYTVTRYIEP